MILEVQHETRLAYSAPVTESMSELHLEPVSDEDQSCRSFHLAVRPRAEVFRYPNSFGNRVHHFNLLAPHAEVQILAASIVETHPRRREVAAARSPFPVNLTGADLGVLDFLQFRGPVRRTPLLNPLLEALRPSPGTAVGEVVCRVSRAIRERFEYARDVTLASSPIDDVLRQGKGVCQDFTHLMIALLRSFDIPARYVSGYIHRPSKESQSHAWCEAWLPELGWLGLDPTNDRVVDDHFVKVAVGRDFTDVPPNKGIYRGKATESIFVRVQTRELRQLPSLSWQEQLPPLDIPLTAIVARPRSRYDGRPDEESQQQ